jgi:ATP-dependent RNA circularization protein (DNA/RNA ligase family)
VKYPRTKHLPWSDSITKDDDSLVDDSQFHRLNVVVSEKLDGENSSIYSNGYFHARSINGNEHPSQGWIKSFLQNFVYNIPEGWRICGENLYAEHSIHYDNLPTYFMVFSIWNEKNECLSWDETEEYCHLLGLQHVPVLYKGLYNKDAIHNAFLNLDHIAEGYVVRTVNGFHYTDFQKCIAKYVRPNHVAETQHNWRMRWDSSKINKLKMT